MANATLSANPGTDVGSAAQGRRKKFPSANIVDFGSCAPVRTPGADVRPEEFITSAIFIVIGAFCILLCRRYVRQASDDNRTMRAT